MKSFVAALLCVGVVQDASAAEQTVVVRLLQNPPRSEATLRAKTFRCDGLVLPLTEPVLVVAEDGRVRVRVGKHMRSCRGLVAVGPGEIDVYRDQVNYAGSVEVRADGRGLLFDLSLDLESYIAQVLAAEAGELRREALAAHAVVSRSYAVANRRRHGASGYDFCDLTHCQLFRGALPAGADARLAVDETRGRVLMIADEVVSAFFHSACGGRTADSADIFEEPGVRGVSDLRSDGTALCARAENFEWSATVDASKVTGSTGETRVLRKSEDGRVAELIVRGQRFNGPRFLAEVNRKLGHSTLRSTRFDLREHDGKLFFKGRGVGHGVGFCQAGANALAKEGKSAAEILKHYFPDADVTKR